MCYSEPVVVNHGDYAEPVVCESCCVNLSQWLLIMVCYDEPVAVNHGLSCCGKGCGSW